MSTVINYFGVFSTAMCQQTLSDTVGALGLWLVTSCLDYVEKLSLISAGCAGILSGIDSNCLDGVGCLLGEFTDCFLSNMTIIYAGVASSLDPGRLSTY